MVMKSYIELCLQVYAWWPSLEVQLGEREGEREREHRRVWCPLADTTHILTDSYSTTSAPPPPQGRKEN